MNIVVCVKQVLDTRLPIHVTQEGMVFQREPSPVYVLNASDRSAVEEALRLRDTSRNGQVTALTVAPARAEAVLAYCLARGVDSVVHLLLEQDDYLDSFSVARVLSIEIPRRSFDLVLCGNRTDDDGAGEIGPVLAEFLNVPQITNAVNLSVAGGDDKLIAERKLERGYRQTVEVKLPALVTVDTSICRPRYVTARANKYGANLLSQKGSVAPVRDAGLLGYGGSLRQTVGRTPPRPRPKKIIQPDAGMSAEDRIAMLIGGAMPSKSSQRSTGGGESLADEIIAFLRDRGLIA